MPARKSRSVRRRILNPAWLPVSLEQPVSRRHFLETTVRSAVILGGAGAVLSCPGWLRDLLEHATTAASAATTSDLLKRAPLARYWIAANAEEVRCASCHAPDDGVTGTVHAHAEKFVKCLLCAQGCVIEEGERGKCRSRMNVAGEMRSLVYGRPATIHVDPIEKKPFYHFLPGSEAFSMATTGCPLHCRFCQNWELSQASPEDYESEFIPAGRIVEATQDQSAPVIAFTYNEPTVFIEYLTDIAREARARGIRSVIVSCGFMNEDPLAEMCSLLDGIKIDLKGYDRDFYRRVCSAELDPVLRSIRQVAASGVHLEIVNLVVPTLNDSEKMLTALVKWIADDLGPDVPVHFTRFHPDYQLLNLPPTPVSTLEKAYEIARAHGLHYPYVGNVPGHPGNHTHCPRCGKIVVARSNFFVQEIHVKDGHCEYCGERIAGVWS